MHWTILSLCVSVSQSACWMANQTTTDSNDSNASFSVNRLFVCNVCVPSFHRFSLFARTNRETVHRLKSLFNHQQWLDAHTHTHARSRHQIANDDNASEPKQTTKHTDIKTNETEKRHRTAEAEAVRTKKKHDKMKNHELKLTLNEWWTMSWRSCSRKTNIHIFVFGTWCSSVCIVCARDCGSNICARVLSTSVVDAIKRLIGQIKFSYQFTLCPFYPIFSPHAPILSVFVSFTMCLRGTAKTIEQHQSFRVSMVCVCVCERSFFAWNTACQHDISRRSSSSCHQIKSNNATLAWHYPSIVFPICFFAILYHIIKIIIHHDNNHASSIECLLACFYLHFVCITHHVRWAYA